ncbi:MAG: protein phosphatase 2C domain-containing protein [Pirellulaceae bacterium]|nr:protein phosphatase 2C domain-containing protein [Pirellulaceae bacterium]
MTSSVRYSGKTDIGKKRQTNQDHFLVADLSRSLCLGATSLDIAADSRLFGDPLGHLFLVADGMGGHQAGSRASELAIKYIVSSVLNGLRLVSRPEAGVDQLFMEALKTALNAAHRAIVTDSEGDQSLRGMGTTLTMAYVCWPKMWVVHAGDTRCYVLRNGGLHQLTRDHTLANQMASQGLLQTDQKERSRWSNVLWNALGAEAEDIVADVHQIRVQVGDRILLCSDGLNKHVTDDELIPILSRDDLPDQICQALIDLTNERGGTDNVTAIVVDIVQPPSSELVTSISTPRAQESILGKHIDYSRVIGETTEEIDGDTESVDTLEY